MSAGKAFLLILTAGFAAAGLIGLLNFTDSENEPIMGYVSIGVIAVGVISHICVWIFVPKMPKE